MSYLDNRFDPIPELAKIRADDPSAMQPFATLGRINKHRQREPDGYGAPDEIRLAIDHRKEQLGFANLKERELALWYALEKGLSERQTLGLLRALQKFEIPVRAYLATVARNQADSPRLSLLRGIVERLKGLPAKSLSTRLLHPDNPFASSHELLDRETPDNLAKLFASVRFKVELSIGTEPSRLRRLVSALIPTDSRTWWWQFLKAHASSSNGDASKVALLLAHELIARKRRVSDLFWQMRRHRTRNPQAALFCLDLEDARIAAIGATLNSPTQQTDSTLPLSPRKNRTR